MSKAFTKETDNADEDIEEVDVLTPGTSNYVTPEGLSTLKPEFRHLLNEARPKIVEVVSWAAGNGDRSENGDYIYGKKRLGEIDRRIRYLTKRIEGATLVDPAQQKNRDQIFFGATVDYRRENGELQTVKIVGYDEADLASEKISWLSPVARTLMKARVGDILELRTPSGVDTLEVLAIRYSASSEGSL